MLLVPGTRELLLALPRVLTRRQCHRDQPHSLQGNGYLVGKRGWMPLLYRQQILFLFQLLVVEDFPLMEVRMIARLRAANHLLRGHHSILLHARAFRP